MYGQSYYNPSVINRLEENKAKKAGVALKTAIISGGRSYPIYKEGDNAVVYIGNVKHILPDSKKIIKENKSMSILFQDAMNKKSSKQEETKTKASAKKVKDSKTTGAPGNSAPSLSAFRREMEGLLREPKPDPLPEWAFNLDDFANHFGLMLKYEDILKEKEAATDAKFKEYDTQAQRAEHGVLRAQDAAYDQYLQGLRNQTANAVSTGAMRGANQANALAEMLAMQQGNKETGTAFSDLMFDLMQQRGTAREEDKLWARDLEQQRRFKIADYEQGRYATLVNDRVGDLNYAGAVNAAGLNALGYYMQGLASAAGTRDAARIGTQGQMQAQQDQWDKALAGLTAGNKMSVNEAMNRLGYSQLLGTSGTFDPKAYDKFWNN